MRIEYVRPSSPWSLFVWTSLLFTAAVQIFISSVYPRWWIAGLRSLLQRAEEHCVWEGGPELHPSHRQERLPSSAQPRSGVSSQPADGGAIQGYWPWHAGHLLCPECARLQSRTHSLWSRPRQCHLGESVRQLCKLILEMLIVKDSPDFVIVDLKNWGFAKHYYEFLFKESFYKLHSNVI